MDISSTCTSPALATKQDVEDGSALPLCVDLDGTLLRTDTLHEAFLHLLRHRPWQALAALMALARGKAALKRAVTAQAGLDPTTLPVHEPFLAWLKEQKQAGRELTLYSAADHHLVEAIAAHTGLFDHAEGSDGRTNLAGRAKLRAMQARYPQGFAYAGNAPVDLAIWQEAKAAIVVGDGDRLAARAAALAPLEARFSVAAADAATWRTWLKALRLHQWAKNLLLLVPVLLAGRLAGLADYGEAALGVVIFGLLASAGYVANDLLDLEADRHHKSKRLRPFAAGRLSIRAGVLGAGLLLLAALVLMAFMPLLFWPVALGYFVGTLGYSLVLKREPMLDVLVLGGLFTLRVLAGAMVLAAPVSFWLLSFSMFLFTSLALVKRYTELAELVKVGTSEVVIGRGYTVVELALLLALGAGTAIAANVIFLIYLIEERFPSGLYQRPGWLWLVFPLLMFWLMRVWRLAVQGRMDEDPVLFALKDRTSLLIGGMILAVILLAR
jgi:4-hydroxybenzoate polyprenyltransferase